MQKPAVPLWGWIGLCVLLALAIGLAGGTGVLDGRGGWIVALVLGVILGALLMALFNRSD
jgi:hypothetical protein